MKRNFVICAILAAAMMLVPLLSMRDSVIGMHADENPSQQSSTKGYISVFKTQSRTVEMLEEREYLIGALSAEADMTYHDEALKAQVIACYTYSLYVREKENDENLMGADITDSSDKHQGYITEEERRKRWGDNFEKYEKKAGDIVDAVFGQVIYYEDKPILAVYHDLNNGRTQSALTVWKEDILYLQEADSPGDKLATDAVRNVELSYDDFKEKISIIDGVEIKGDEKDWIGKTINDDSGYVKSIDLCGNTVSAVDFRTALDLESCCFRVKAEEDIILIEVTGRGHFVGMSQYGADYMARQGADYREILTHYYQGTKII